MPESCKLDVFQKYVPDIQGQLAAGTPGPTNLSKRTRSSLRPMEVMDTPYRAGDLRHGYQAVADNLPNDPRIHEQKGSKKIFFKNFMDARVNYGDLAGRQTSAAPRPGRVGLGRRLSGKHDDA